MSKTLEAEVRRLVEDREGLFSARPKAGLLLAYYANSIAHFA